MGVGGGVQQLHQRHSRSRHRQCRQYADARFIDDAACSKAPSAATSKRVKALFDFDALKKTHLSMRT